MEIAEKNGSVHIATLGKKAVGNPKDKSMPSGSGSDRQAPVEDRVVLSDHARKIQRAKQQLQTVSDVRTEKVAELRQRIEAGQYEIDADRIAEKMLKDAILTELL